MLIQKIVIILDNEDNVDLDDNNIYILLYNVTFQIFDSFFLFS